MGGRGAGCFQASVRPAVAYTTQMPFRDTIIPFVSSRTLGYVALMAIAVGIYSLLPVVKESSSYRDIGDIPSDMYGSLSLILGCLLVFRTNTAYNRWWEARTLWGTLVNTERNLAVKLTTLVDLNEGDRNFLKDSLSQFPQQLMVHLRSPRASTTHVPINNVRKVYEWMGQERKTGKLDAVAVRVIDMELAKLLEVCGACERIARTPMIHSYRVFVRQCIAIFLFSFPWGIAQDFQWWTVPLTIIVSYFMLGMEVVAENVEEPFGLDDDDLDLEGMCKTIEQSMHEVFDPSLT